MICKNRTYFNKSAKSRILDKSECEKLKDLCLEDRLLFKKVSKNSEWAAVWFTKLDKERIEEIGQLERDDNLIHEGGSKTFSQVK